MHSETEVSDQKNHNGSFFFEISRKCHRAMSTWIWSGEDSSRSCESCTQVSIGKKRWLLCIHKDTDQIWDREVRRQKESCRIPCGKKRSKSIQTTSIVDESIERIVRMCLCESDRDGETGKEDSISIRKRRCPLGKSTPKRVESSEYSSIEETKNYKHVR